MKKVTESNSLHNQLESKSTFELLQGINQEDQKVALAVNTILSDIEGFVDNCYQRMIQGGRLFYIGAGTSGRLGILDASECPPTFGVEAGKVIGLIAGGDNAIRNAVENAEDDINQGWNDLQEHNISKLDSVVGIAASGSTPYVVEAIKTCNENGILTGGISCNPGSLLELNAIHSMTPLVGPEFITGSTRMKSGTAQKLILNMISTSLMIKLGHIKGNKMVDMQLSNDKLVDRGVKMIQSEITISYEEAKILLLENGSVRNAIAFHQKK